MAARQQEGDWLQTLTVANPVRHFLVIVKGLFLKAQPASEVALDLLPLVVIAAVTLTASRWLFRQRIE
jgi:ABC-2 type transport system permease protein